MMPFNYFSNCCMLSQCVSEKCHAQEFQCKNFQCIPREAYCDGISTCSDASDEVDCGQCFVQMIMV